MSGHSDLQDEVKKAKSKKCGVVTIQILETGRFLLTSEGLNFSPYTCQEWSGPQGNQERWYHNGAVNFT